MKDLTNKDVTEEAFIIEKGEQVIDLNNSKLSLTVIAATSHLVCNIFVC